MLVFILIGLFDRLFGNKLGLGTEFEKGLSLFGSLILTMAGMIVLAPLLARICNPFFSFVYQYIGIDPSVITSSIFANDMGGAQLAKAVAKNDALGGFNGLVIGSMLGATISFTIPFALGTLKENRQKEFILGLLCGIITTPIGCAFGILISEMPYIIAFINLIPLTIFAIIISLCLLLFPKVCMKAFEIFGIFIKVLVSVGLALGLTQYLTGFELIKGLGTFEEGAGICLKSAVALSGAFPLIHIISKLLDKPLGVLSRKIGINDKSAIGFISSLASNIPTIEMMDKMDQKGAVLNSAFSVSASFLIADHLAFTLAFNGTFLAQVMLSKIISGVSAVIFANFIYKKIGKSVLNNEYEC